MDLAKWRSSAEVNAAPHGLGSDITALSYSDGMRVAVKGLTAVEV